MRYREFNLTEDELFELKMSPSNLAKMAKDIDARAGLEFEMYVPNVDADDDDEYDSEPDYEADESFPTGPGWTRDIIDFFRGGEMGSSTREIQRAIDDLNENFYAWVYEDQEEWINSNLGQARVREIAYDNIDKDAYDTEEELIKAVQDYINENEDSIREQIIDEYNDDLDSKFEEWLDDQGINSMSDFGNEYNLEWPYWTEPERSRGGADINAVARDFGDAIGRRVTTGGYHSGAYNQTDNYRVETDSSLSDPEESGDAGLEFVSPPLTIPEMLEDIKKVSEWANRVGAYTNSTTGLHMNVSVPGYSMQQLDYVKLAVFLGDEYILEQFGRAGNTYCRSALNKIKAEVKQDPARLTSMLKAMQGELNSIASKIVHTGNTDKYTSINTQSNRVEFRGPGNDWLGELADGKGLIENTLLRTVVALDIAMKPEAFRQEYMKKLYKVLTPTEFAGARGQRQERVVSDTQDVISLFAKYAAGELPRAALKSFVKQLRLERGKKLPPGSDTPMAIYQIVNNNSGEVLSPGVERTWDQAVGYANNMIQAYQIPREDIRIIDLGNNESFYITGHPDSGPRATNSHPEGRGRPHDPNGRYAIVSREDPAAYQTGRGTEPEYQFRFNMSNPAEQHNGRYILAAWAARNSVDPANYIVVDTERWDTPAVAGEQSSDANYEIIDLETNRPVFRFIANTDEEASRKFEDWVTSSGGEGRYGWRRISGRGIPGSTAELQRQRAEQVQGFRVSYTVTYAGEVRNNTVTIQARNADAAMDVMRTNLERAGYTVDRIEAEPVEGSRLPDPPEAVDIGSMPSRDQEFTGIWEVVSRNTDEVVHNFSGIGNAVADATIYANRWARTTGFDDPIYVRPLMRARDNVPRQQGEVQAHGTESLPSGNTRWRVLDSNDHEVYSFIGRSNQGEANVAAANWLRREGLLGSQAFMVVPAR